MLQTTIIKTLTQELPRSSHSAVSYTDGLQTRGIGLDARVFRACGVYKWILQVLAYGAS